jgi:hypothetical protein
MIRAKCTTTIDNVDCKAISMFAAIPNINDKVRVLRNGKKDALKVLSVTHDVGEFQENSGNNGYTVIAPFIHVELG